MHVPLGTFVLDESSDRTAILISGGTGITPMLSMFERIAQHSTREAWFLHGTRCRSQHAFGDAIRKTAQSRSNLKVAIFYDSVGEDDLLGVHHDESGYIAADELRQHIPIFNAEFYYCGPVPFLRAIECALETLKVPQERYRCELLRPIRHCV